jgi:hypothetical protein
MSLPSIIVNTEKADVPFDIEAIFDINEVADMDISDNELDDTLDRILDATDGVGQMWEIVDDYNTMNEGLQEIERVKTYSFPVAEYEKWIKDLGKAGLNYVLHEHRQQPGMRNKNKWTERWQCHRYGTYKSIAGKNPHKKSRPLSWSIVRLVYTSSFRKHSTIHSATCSGGT